jgi:Leucine-rich repeat (LRR) protein
MINIANTFLQELPNLSHRPERILNASHNRIQNLWEDDFPPGIEELDLEGNDILSDGLLAEWPQTLRRLNLSYNPIWSIAQTEQWPLGLVSLNLSNTNLSDAFQAAALPDSLQFLNLSNTQITHIYKFPNSLKEFKCDRSQLRWLPEVCPNSLEVLIASRACLTDGSLPSYWGNSLKILDLNCNFIREIPKLPPTLRILNLTYNRIQIIPDLPRSLELLHLNLNRILVLPPWLSARPLQFTIQKNCLTEEPMMPNCITGTHQWIGHIYNVSARQIQRKWRIRCLKAVLRTWKRMAAIKHDLIAEAMHPDRAGQYEDISPEWSDVLVNSRTHPH